MELALVIWAVGTLPGLASGMCLGLFLVSIVAIALKVTCAIASKVDNDKAAEHFSGIAGKVCWISIPLWFLFLLVPNKETAYTMMAAYGVQTLVQNETAQSLGADGVDVLKLMLEKAKKDISAEAKAPSK
jgi:hypothetical protein